MRGSAPTRIAIHHSISIFEPARDEQRLALERRERRREHRVTAVRAVVARGAHPSLRVLWDVMHPQRQLETVAESYVPHIAALGLPLRHPSEISALTGTQLL